MPGQTLSLTIATQLQKAGFTEAAEQMRKLQAEVEGVEKKTSGWDQATSKLKTALVALGTVAFYRQAADEAGKAEDAQNRLRTSVESSGTSWDRVASSVNEFTGDLSELSRFAKGDLDSALNILIQRTNSLAVSQANMKTVMGISVQTGRDLADVADQVGRAANGSQRDVQQLAKAFGITGENAKNADYVLNTLAARFDKSAEAEQGVTKITHQMNNAWGDLKETFGNLIKGPIMAIEIALTRLIRVVTSVIQTMVDLDKAAHYLFRGDTKTAMEHLKNAGKDLVGIWDDIVGKLPEKMAKTGGKTTAAAHQLRDELLQFVTDTARDTDKILAGIGANAQARATAEGELQKQQVRARMDFQILAAQEQARVLLAIDANTAAKKKAIAADEYNVKLQKAYQYGAAIGAATGRLVAGEKEAWKDIVDTVIDALVKEMTAVLAIRQAEAIASEVAKGGWYGLVTGAAQAAVIAGLGAAAKSALRGGGTVSAGAAPGGNGGGGGSFGGGGSASAPAAAPSQQPTTNIRIVVQGDMVNDPAYTDRLIRKISEAVENRNVRLVATKVGAEG